MNQVPPAKNRLAVKLPPYWPWLTTAAVVLAFGLCWLGFTASRHHNPTSPDEAANVLMAEQYAHTGTMTYVTALTPAQLQIYHPRSLTIRDGNLLPGSFLGFVMIQGWMLKAGDWAPYALTVIVFALALLAWYRICRRYWSWPWALGSVFLFASLPVILAHVVLPMVQPALYVCFLVITGLAVLRFQEKQTWTRAVAVGLIYGLALFVRPVEVLFTGPIIAVLMLVHKGKRKMFFATFLTTLIVQLPWLILSWKTFGAFLATGYTSGGVSLTSGGSGMPWWKAIFVPAGGHWDWHFVRSTWDYLFMLYPAMSLMSAGAVIIYFRRKLVSWVKVLKIGAVVAFVAYYLAYYGSWNLYPNELASRIGSAASYARYWIPLYVGMCAGVIVFLRKVMARKLIWAMPVIVLLIAANGWIFWNHPSGYAAQIRRDDEVNEVVTKVEASAAPHSLIVAGQDEKYLLGKYLVAFHYPNTNTDWQVLREIVTQRPVYILPVSLSTPFQRMNELASGYGLRVSVVDATPDGDLWRVEINANSDES